MAREAVDEVDLISSRAFYAGIARQIDDFSSRLLEAYMFEPRALITETGIAVSPKSCIYPKLLEKFEKNQPKYAAYKKYLKDTPSNAVILDETITRAYLENYLIGEYFIYFNSPLIGCAIDLDHNFTLRIEDGKRYAMVEPILFHISKKLDLDLIKNFLRRVDGIDLNTIFLNHDHRTSEEQKLSSSTLPLAIISSISSFADKDDAESNAEIILRYFFSLGLSPNLTGFDNTTALHLAMEEDYRFIIGLYFSVGADLSIKRESDGKSPEDIMRAFAEEASDEPVYSLDEDFVEPTGGGAYESKDGEF